MTIIAAHNFYQQPGGEDQVFAAEVDLLRRHGHEVYTFELHNDAVDHMGRVRTLAATFWNRQSHRNLSELVGRTRAQVVHFHNTFPLISPAAYKAARDHGAAVVQTLHNFRLICPSALLLRNGKPCEKCVGRTFAWPGVQHRCYRESRQASAAVAGMTAAHRVLGTWYSAVDLYVAPTAFARGKLIEGGLPAAKIAIKPNFVDPDPGIGAGKGGYALFVGRLSQEKGIETLLGAWRELGEAMPLKIIGDGPLSASVVEAVSRQPSIEWLGRRPPAEVHDCIGNAMMLISPSQCYETFGRVIVEAFAKGTPAIASGHGAAADLIRHGQTGLLFKPGNPRALADAVRELMGNEPLRARLRETGRREYEQQYTGARNHATLMDVYSRAIAERRGACQAVAAGQMVRSPMTEARPG